MPLSSENKNEEEKATQINGEPSTTAVNDHAGKSTDDHRNDDSIVNSTSAPPADTTVTPNLVSDKSTESMVSSTPSERNSADQAMTEIKPVSMTMNGVNDNDDDDNEETPENHNMTLHQNINHHEPEAKGRALNFTSTDETGTSSVGQHMTNEKSSDTTMNFVTTVQPMTSSSSATLSPESMARNLDDLSDVSMDDDLEEPIMSGNDDDDDDDLEDGTKGMQHIAILPPPSLSSSHHSGSMDQQLHKQPEITSTECINNGKMYKVSEHFDDDKFAYLHPFKVVQLSNRNGFAIINI